MSTNIRIGSISILLSVTLLSCSGMQSGAGPSHDTVVLKEYGDRIKSGIPPIDSENRLYVYETMDYWAHILRTSKVMKELKTRKTNTFPDHPYLTIFDSDQNGQPDQFTYEEKKGKPSEEFGFIFDLNKDGVMDYVVFNGGPLITKDLARLMWMNRHFIDSDFDGKLDIMVFNDIDLNGDHELDTGVTAWIYDPDFDGGIDSAEYLGYTPVFPIGGTVWIPEKGARFQQTITVKDDMFLVREFIGEKSIPVGGQLGGIQDILNEINETIQ